MNTENLPGARFNRPERNQVQMRMLSLDQMIAEDHQVRVVWRYVASLDLSGFAAKVRAVEGSPGRNAVDPRILLSLWMFATLEGIGSARRLAKLCERDFAYMWICGEVGVNHHLLSDFRSDHGDLVEQLLVDSIATLMQQDLVKLESVAQDGMRVRANAGSSSFRRDDKLHEYQAEVREQLSKLAEEQENNPGDDSARKKAAKQRAIENRKARIEKALEEHAKLREQKEKNKKGTGDKARASTTDPEARIMKMGDGGFRPAYNVQFVSDSDARMIAGVDVTNSGSDRGQMAPLYEQLNANYGVRPKDYMVDGAFVTGKDVTQLERAGTRVLGPVPNEKKALAEGKDPYARKRNDTDEMAGFRERMRTDEAKEDFKRRGAVAEFPNAVCRNHGLYQFPVRNLRNVKAIAVLHAFVFNFQRMLNLGWIT